MIDIFIDMSTKSNRSCEGEDVMFGFIRFKMILWMMDHKPSWNFLTFDEFVLDLGQK